MIFLERVFTMKMICPTCNSNVDCGNVSRFSIFQCGCCDTQFRGIHANANIVNSTVRTISRMVMPLHIILGGDTLQWWETPCPYCWHSIPLTQASVGFNSPDNCGACGQSLPKDKISQKPTKKAIQKLVEQGKIDIPDGYENSDISFLFEKL